MFFAWWLLGSTLGSKLLAVQRAVISSVLRLPRETGEEDVVYACRRGREAGRHVSRVGAWDVRAARRIVEWAEHLQRGHVSSWAVSIFPFQCSKWLQVRRAAQNSISIFAGVLGLRQIAGRPRIWFEEGLSYAKDRIAEPERNAT